MYSNILVPTTLSANSKKVFEIAQKIAADGAKVTVLHVLEEIPQYVANHLPENYADANHRTATADLAKAVQGHDGFQTKVITGHAGRSIVEEAEASGADCIVMSSHTPGGLQDMLIGSTAAYVVRHSKSSVHVIRQD